MTEREELMWEIIREKLIYRPASSPFGERAERERKMKEKMDRLTVAEKRQVKEEIEKIKSKRIQELFESFYRELLVEMFAAGGIGHPVVNHLSDATGVFIDFYQNFDRILTAETSPWLGERSLESVYRQAFSRVDEAEDRRWGEVNRLTLTNILLGGKLPRFLGFDRGPIPIRGGRATPHQGQIYRAGERLTSFTPSLRLVADMSAPALHTALCGGPSDRRFSKWYTIGVDGWLAGSLKVRKPPK